MKKLISIVNDLSMKEKIICMVGLGIIFLMCFSFFTGKFINYTDSESREARFFAINAQENITMIEGLTVLKQTMSAKPNPGWGISFMFKYEHTNEILIERIKEKNWKYLGYFKDKNYIKDTQFYAFCQNAVLLKVFLDEKPTSVHMGFEPEICKPA